MDRFEPPPKKRPNSWPRRRYSIRCPGADNHEEVRITDDDATRLQSLNPKGRLLEWCAKRAAPGPRFERDASADGYRIRGVMPCHPEREIITSWYVAPQLRTAEQAAAEAILQQLPEESSDESRRDQPVADTPPGPVPDPDSGRNPVMVLNELTQAGLLRATGYELLDQTGPSHQPTFATVAWATLPDGRTLRTEPLNGPSKKAGQRAAADRLLDLLVQEGITRR